VIEDPEPPHAHHHKSGIAWLDLALALAVIALSVGSLVTAQHTGHTMERLVNENSRLVRANATPLLQFDQGNVRDDAAGGVSRAIYFNVANVGTGTARVIWFEIARDNTPMRSIFKLIDYQPRAADKDYITTTAVANTYLPAGEHRFIMSWPVPKSVESLSRWNALDATRSTLVASACFCSVLGECWTSHLRADLPQPVKQCDARGHRNFEG